MQPAMTMHPMHPRPCLRFVDTLAGLPEIGRLWSMMPGWFLSAALAAASAAAQPGSVDETWGAGLALNAWVQPTVVQPDGKILIGGGFTSAGGTNWNHLARLNQDGSLDEGFNIGSGPDSFVYAIALQSDGGIVVAGSFTHFNGAQRNRVARLEPDGTLDTSFDPGDGPNGDVWSAGLLSSGDLLLTGQFTAFDGLNVGNIVRLQTDGLPDPTFSTVADAPVDSFALQPDSRIVIAGQFSQVNGVGRNRVARINADGSLDVSFDPGAGPDKEVYTAVVEADAKIVIGGAFLSVNGLAQRYLCRLTPDGLPDLSFTPSVDDRVYRAILQPDGRMLISGYFASVNGQSRSRIARLRTDGSLDPSFDVGTGATDWTVVTLEPDGSILVGGNFAQFNGESRSFLVHLQGLSTALGGELEFGSPIFQVRENAGPATIQVRRTGNTSSQVDVEFASSPGTASVDDFTSTGGRLTFGPNETSKTFQVPIRNDLNPEDDETVNLTLANPTGGAALGSQQIALLEIINDDAFANSGGLDTGFPAGFNGYLNSVAVQPDGKILAVGDFSGCGLVGRLRLARLNKDGSVDSTFNPAAWVDSAPYRVVLQPDGKILLSGLFTVVNGQTRNRLARLNTDGSLDLGFDPGNGFSDWVSDVVVLGDGGILISGGFTKYGANNAGPIARIYSDGGLDPGFAVTVNGVIYAMAVQPDGRIVIGGAFTAVNGTTRNHVARLLSDGSLESSFDPGLGTDNYVQALAFAPDEKIVIAGPFQNVSSTGIRYLSRLNSDGTPDVTFAPALDNTPYRLAFQPDGKLVLAGMFTVVNGQSRSRVARLLNDGTLDSSFDLGTGANDWCAATLQPDGNILVYGAFINFNGFTRMHIARLRGQSAASGGEIEFP